MKNKFHRIKIRKTGKRLFSMLFVVLFVSLNLQAQELLINANGVGISGTLLMPDAKTDVVCIIVPGSGDIDRDGNSKNGLNTDAYKLLAAKLAKSEIASFRYDKRGVGASASANFKERDMKFETNVSDLKALLYHLKSLNKFRYVFLIGHSEGSLVSILLAKDERIDGLISVAGAAKNAGDLIISQIDANRANPEILRKSANDIVKRLQNGELVNDVPPMLEPLFRASVQPYLISWFKYEPSREISGLKIPSLIVHGDFDAQVSPKDAQELANASGAQLKIIKNMTHTLKEITSPSDNLASYIDPSYEISGKLVEAIVKFIADIKAR